jgi:hypothetical protein
MKTFTGGYGPKHRRLIVEILLLRIKSRQRYNYFEYQQKKTLNFHQLQELKFVICSLNRKFETYASKILSLTASSSIATRPNESKLYMALAAFSVRK